MPDNKNTPAPVFGSVADAPADNWVDRYAPQWSRPYLRMSRADRPIGTWLLLIPCWWGLMLAMLINPMPLGWYEAWMYIACAIGAFLMRGAGCTWNDISDRHIDAQVERTKSRPLPSGQITTRQALVWMGIQCGVSFAILLTFNLYAILLGVLALLPVLIYPFAKRFTWWPQFFLGIAFNWGALFGWAAYAGNLSWAAVFLYLSGICWTLFYDTIYAHQDKEDDALIGVKSTARLFADNTKRWLLLFLVMTLSLMAVSVFFVAVNTLHPIITITTFIGVLAFGYHLTWQLKTLDINDPENCLFLFRTNKNAGLLVALIWGILLIMRLLNIVA